MVPFEDELRRMPAVVVEAARGLPGSLVADRPLAGGFAMVEHVWHLADLETDAYEVRIRRILEEDEPALAGFDGEAVAAQRKYRALRLRDGIKKFTAARERTLAALALWTATRGSGPASRRAWAGSRCATSRG